MISLAASMALLFGTPASDEGGFLTPQRAESLRPGLERRGADSALHGLRVVRRYQLDCGKGRCEVVRLALFQGSFSYAPDGVPSQSKVMALPYFVFRDLRTRRIVACGTHRNLLDGAGDDRAWIQAAFDSISRRDRTAFLELGPDASLDFLRRHLNTWPPKLGEDPESQQVPEVFRRTESVLLRKVRSNPASAKAHRDLGDLWRMGRNMGVEEDLARSDAQLREALRLDPRDALAHYLLGSLHLRPDRDAAALAEPEFQWVRRNATGLLRRRSLWGLALCAWLQGRTPEALQYARTYLSEGPADQETEFLRETLEREAVRKPGRP